MGAFGPGTGTQTGGSRRVFPVPELVFQLQVPPRAGELTALKACNMSRKLELAGTIALAATFTLTLLSAEGSGAAAMARESHMIRVAPDAAVTDLNISQNITETPATEISARADQQDEVASDAPAVEAPVIEERPVSAATLTDMVTRQATSAPLSRELNCLAGAIYFESKSEPLLGQLAVGRVVVARSSSGRFPTSYCGVVFQPSQFSFVRGGAMPGINKGSGDWKEAVAIAQIAHEGSWRSPVEGALFFHAARVSPGWRMMRIAKVGNHIFYR